MRIRLYLCFSFPYSTDIQVLGKEIYFIICFHQHLLNLLHFKLHTHSTKTILLQIKGKKIIKILRLN
jgi:hypothetical protein